MKQLSAKCELLTLVFLDSILLKVQKGLLSECKKIFLAARRRCRLPFCVTLISETIKARETKLFMYVHLHLIDQVCFRILPRLSYSTSNVTGKIS